MKKFLVILAFANLLFVIWVYGIFGFLVLILAMLGFYGIVVKKELLSGWRAQKIVMLFPYIVGVFAVNTFFQIPMLSIFIGILEAVAYIVFVGFDY